MTGFTEIILAALLGTDLFLACASRLFHCIKIVAFQGVMLGLLPLIMWDWQASPPHGQMIFVAAVNLLIKGILLPCLLILPHFWGAAGVWYSMPVSDLLASLIALFMLLGQFRQFKAASRSASAG